MDSHFLSGFKWNMAEHLPVSDLQLWHCTPLPLLLLSISDISFPYLSCSSVSLTFHSLTSPAPQYLWHFTPLPLLLLSISDISLPYLSCSSVSLTFHSLTSPAPQYLWHFTPLPLLLLSISDISLPYLSCSSVSLSFLCILSLLHWSSYISQLFLTFYFIDPCLLLLLCLSYTHYG